MEFKGEEAVKMMGQKRQDRDAECVEKVGNGEGILFGYPLRSRLGSLG